MSIDTLTRANKIHPISAVQTEYSLWSRDAEQGMLKFCEQNNITFVAYSPLGRGFLTGAIRSIDDLDDNDFRRIQPRFSADNFDKNLQLVDKVLEIAMQKSTTPAQIALAWVLKQSPKVVAIPGTRSITRLEENISAFKVDFTEEELNLLNSIFDGNKIHGNRYNEFGMKLVNI